jgi:hypothetical protein
MVSENPDVPGLRSHAPAQELHQVYILIAEQHPTTSVPAGAETALAPSRRNRNFGTPQVLFYT